MFASSDRRIGNEDRDHLPVLVVVGALLLAVICVASLFLAPNELFRDAIDFRSFYCAARTVEAGGNPYLAEPLRSCENAGAKTVGLEAIPGLTLPAPLPGYAFVPLMPLAHLPYPLANRVYAAGVLAATIGSVVLLARLTGLPALTIAASLALGEAFQALRLGQIVPLCLLSLLAAAYLIERRRPWGAAAALGVAMIEPHVALPALVALFSCVPEARLAVATVAAVLALLAWLALGTGPNLLYLTTILPAHARAELHMNSYQFSLANLLHQLGVADHLALGIAEAAYLGLIALGILLARGPARRRPALLILTPCALALVGGPFLHLVQIICALPLALLLVGESKEHRLPLLAAVLLSVPWLEAARTADPATVAAFASIAVLPIALHALPKRQHAFALTALLAILGAGITVIWQDSPHAPRPDAKAALAAVSDPGLPAESSWKVFIEMELSANEPRYLLAKLPTWTGLALLLVSAAAFARKEVAD